MTSTTYTSHRDDDEDSVTFTGPGIRAMRIRGINDADRDTLLRALIAAHDAGAENAREAVRVAIGVRR